MRLKRYKQESITTEMIQDPKGEYVKYTSYQNAVRIFLQGKLEACFCDDVGQYPLCEQCRVIRKLLGEV